jgi:hypothetical protein
MDTQGGVLLTTTTAVTKISQNVAYLNGTSGESNACSNDTLFLSPRKTK